MTGKNDNPLRLGVLLSGGGRTLTNILDHITAGKLDAQVVVVIASRPCKGIALAQQANLPVHLIAAKGLDEETFSRQVTERLDAAEVDLVCLAGFLSFWRVPDHYQGRVMNIHPALLPSFGGPGMYGHHVHEAVLGRGCKVSGCTVHFVNNEYDRGPIILQRCVPVLEGDDADALAARVFEQECIALPEAIGLFGNGRLRIEGDIVRVMAPDWRGSAGARNRRQP
jgi:formyltetrahydrofolate-dependent phosphoribosylglycinamide formyltransferase